MFHVKKKKTEKCGTRKTDFAEEQERYFSQYQKNIQDGSSESESRVHETSHVALY